MKYVYGLMVLVIWGVVVNGEVGGRDKGMEFVRRNGKLKKESYVDGIGKCLVGKEGIGEDVKKEISEKMERREDIKDVIRRVIVKNKEDVISCVELSEVDTINENDEYDVKKYLNCIQEHALQLTRRNTRLSINKETIEDAALISQLYLALRTHQYNTVESIEQELLSKNNSIIVQCSIHHKRLN